MQRNWLIAAIVVGLLAIAIAVLAMRLSDDDAEAASLLVATHALQHKG